MTVLLFIVVWGLEAALDVREFLKEQTKKMRRLERLALRVSQIVLFFLLMALPGISFSFRTKLLFGLLIIQLIIAAIACLLKGKDIIPKRNIGRMIAGIIVAAFLYGIALIPAYVIREYDGLSTSGAYEVAMTDAIFVDESRKETFEEDGSFREVPVHVYYPKDAQGKNAFPLVIFSHGAFGYYQSNTSTYQELASNGYVVMSLDHPYHSFFTNDTEGNLITVNPDFMNEIFYVNQDNIPEEEIFELSSGWLSLRVADMNFVLDDVIAAVEKGDTLDNWVLNEGENEAFTDALSRIDTEHIGVMGHSLGGAASITIGRVRDDIDAVIDLDGTMIGEQVDYRDGQYWYYEEPYPVPALAIDTQEHHSQGQTYGILYVNNYVIATAVDGREVYFENAGHMNFTDLPLFSPILANALGTGTIDAEHCIRQVNDIVRMYFDHYLKDEGEVTLSESYR